MKIVGLITEYNPFHNGHLYHLKQAKAITRADAVVVVMSGNYVQRGTPAIMPKHLRAKAALASGAAAVIELPVFYAAGSAEYFAAGAVALLDALGCVDSLCFGSECGNYELLYEIAQVIADEPEAYQTALKAFLKDGLAFPLARQKALEGFFKDDEKSAVLKEPNNILGLEYIKALYQLKSPMKGYTIRRMTSRYHDTELNEFCSSASAIRTALSADGFAFSQLQDQLPAVSGQILETAYGIRYPVYSNDFSLILKYKLLNQTPADLCDFADVSEELANRIYNRLNDFISFEQFCMILKTRELTHSRISRALLHIILDIRQQELELFCQSGYALYARILGFRNDDADVLKLIKENSRIPMITRVSSGAKLTDLAGLMFRQDTKASDIYETIVTEKFKNPFINEYTQPVLTM
ncbi:MAG: nucleotidyltransferase [Lachnospiraceae bacterium]